jgi:EmrB/QacA subfamily drug resistance transporter
MYNSLQSVLCLQYKWTVLTVTTIGVIMAGLDARIVIIGLPQVISALGADAEQGIWINQAYMLGSIAVFLLIGRLTDLFGRKHFYTSGFAIFTIGSALTSLATDPLQVILFRIIQGVGAGIILTNSIVIITDATPKNELSFALSINNLGFRVGAMAGLTISGLVLSFIGDWRALFYLNVPIGIFGTIWAHKTIKKTPAQDKTNNDSVDWVGFATFTTFITSLLLVLTFAAYGIGSQMLTLAFSILTVATLAAFVVHENRCQNPLLDFNLFRIREFSGGILALLLNGIAWGAVLLLLSFYFQLVLGYSPLEAGIRIIPFDIAFLIAGPLSGKLSDKFGHTPFTTSGIILSSISLYLFSTVNTATSYVTVTLFMILFGVSMGMFSSPNMSSVMCAVPIQRRGIGSALRSTFLNVGMAFSLNFAILIISFTVPYTIVTQIASGTSTLATLEADRELFMLGLQSTYLWLAALNALAIIPSVLRGKSAQTNKNTQFKSALEGVLAHRWSKKDTQVAR